MHFALIVVTPGQPVIVRTVLQVEKSVKDMELLIILQKSSKTKIPIKPKPWVNNVDDLSSEVANIGTSAMAAEKVIQIETIMQKHSIYDANYDSDYDDFDDNCVAVISDGNSIREVEPKNMHIRFGNTETKH